MTMVLCTCEDCKDEYTPFWAEELTPLRRRKLNLNLAKRDMVEAIGDALKHWDNKCPRFTAKLIKRSNYIYEILEGSFFCPDYNFAAEFYFIGTLENIYRNMFKVFCKATGFKGKIQNLDTVTDEKGSPVLVIRLGVGG